MTATHTGQEIKLKPRTKDVLIEESLEFRGLLLSPCIQEGLTKYGFVRPSPIQLKAIPLGRCGLDLIVQAKSGTGKTCVFAVIALEGILLDSMATQVLVLAPTREIAVQICDVVNNIGSCMPGLKCDTFIGGIPLSEDRLKLARCHIAIGTPGRIKQLIDDKLLKPSSIRLFVLDEADKLLEDSFQEQVNWIFSSLPENKQMLALSATYPEVLAQHLTAYMRNPTYLRLNITDPALLGIRQYYRSVEFNPLTNKLFDSKTDALLALLSSVEFHQCLIFSNYQMRAESLSEVLNFRGWPATYISGSREQGERMAAIASLKQMTCRVLISTDLTSRGIDAENVNLVVNLDLPPNHETYLHRIGRAGRFGTYGAGVSFVAEGKEMDEMRRLEKHCHTTIKPLPDPIPRDLARCSGFVSLEHLVTTETLTTKKEDGHMSPSNPTALPTVSQSEASAPNGGQRSGSASNGGGVPSMSSSNGDCSSDSTWKGTFYGSTSSIDLPSESTSIGDLVCESASFGGTPYESTSNGDLHSRSTSDGNCQYISLPNTDSSSKTNRIVPALSAPTNNVHGNGNSEHDKVEASINPQRELVGEAVKENPRRKMNNVWTNLSYSYGAECKDMDEKRAKGTLVSATASDQRRNRGTRTASSPVKHSENSQNVMDAVPGNGEPLVKIDIGSGDKPVLLKAGKGTKSPMTTPATGQCLPSLRHSNRLPNKLLTYSKLLADYNKYMAEDEGKQISPHIVPDFETTMDTKYEDYIVTVSKLFEDLHKLDQQARVSTVPEDSETLGCMRTDFMKVNNELEQQLGRSLSVDAPTPCPTEELDKDTTKDRESTRGCVHGKQLTPEQLLKNYATLDNDRHSSSHLHDARQGNLGAFGDSGEQLPQCAMNTKPKLSKPKKRASPYGPWQPYVPPPPTEPEPEEEEDEEETDDESEEEGDSDTDSEWESSSLDDVDEEKEEVDKPCMSHNSPEPSTSHSPHKTSGKEKGKQHQYEEPGHNQNYSGQQGYYSHYNSEQGFCPPPPVHGYYPPQYGPDYFPPPSGYGPSPYPWEMPSPPYVAFQNMMYAQQNMLFTTMCYQQYMMHLQQAEFYKRMIQSHQALSKTGDFYQEQERYIRKMAKWMAKNKYK